MFGTNQQSDQGFWSLQGEEPIDELTMERTIEALESHCHDNINHAIETVEGLGIEYDEDVICDVCRSPDSEEGNDMVFCDKCNICVHQVTRASLHRQHVDQGVRFGPSVPLWML